ncbi:MAG: glycoside hydrolase family 140 protein [Chitinophagaceae bacterium]
MQRTIFVLLILITTLGGFAQFSVSNNRRFLLKDGQPFFWLGDTGWELFHRLNREETDRYLKKRSEQGFTVIQAVVLAELDGLHVPNANGDLPLLNDNPVTPNEKYFQHVDYVIEKAASYNISIALLPTWGDKVFKDRWGAGPEIFNEQTAAVYGQWLGNRYKTSNNIIWVLGGDRLPRNDSDIAIWRSMGKAIMKATANKAVISFHPQPNPLGSAQWFHQDDWLSFNMFQTGHCRDAAVYDKIQAVYNLKPFKPVMDAEPIYEDHPVCFNVKDLGTSNALDVRRSAYLDLFAGAFGHTYGCHDVWQMNAPKHAPVNGPHYSWNEALELPGASQMKFVRHLIEAFPMTERVPDQSLIIESNLTPAERIQATRGTNYLFVYSSAGKPFTVVMGKIKGEQVRGYWYDPRNGTKSPIDAVKNTGKKLYTPAGSGYGKDWVLVLYDANAGYKDTAD